MMNKHNISLWVWLAWSSLVAAQATVPPPEKLLGIDTLAVLTVPDWSESSAAFRRSPAAQFWNDPSMKAFTEKFMTRFQADLISPLEKELGIRLKDYQGLAQGQVTLAVTRNGWGEQADREPALVFLVDSEDKGPELKTKIAELKQKWIDSGKSLKNQTIRGVEFTAIKIPSKQWAESLNKALPGSEEELDPDDLDAESSTNETDRPEREWLVGQSESILVLGSSAKDIEQLMARQSGSTLASLGDNAIFAAEAGALFRQAHSYLWVNVNLILNTILDRLNQEESPPENPLMPAPRALVSALGLTGLESLSVAYSETTEGSMITTSVLAPESKRKGILKLFQLEPKDCSPPASVPADAIQFSRLRLNLAQAWNNLEQTLAQAYPPMSGVIAMVLDNAGKDEKNPDFDLRKSLIANLGDDIISYEKAPKSMTIDGLNSPPSLILISSPRAEELAASIRALGGLMPQQGSNVKEREFLGRTIYSMPLPGGVSSEDRPIANNLFYVANGGYVAFSTDTSMVEELLRTGNAKPLSATEGFAQAVEKVGGMNAGFLSYENNAESIRLAFEILGKESGTLANLFNGSGLASRLRMGDQDSKFNDWVDFSLLPPFERVAKYFHFSVYGGTLTTKGYTFRYFAPKPPRMP